MNFDFEQKFSKARRQEFAELLQSMSSHIGFKVSSRGWGYLLEQARYINKDQFDKVEAAINQCRKEGLLPVDFVAEEKARAFSGVVEPSDGSVRDTLLWMLRDVINGAKYFEPDWWKGEDYYIQVVVEKIDLVTLFEPVCKKYRIPIANAKGWSSISQRAEYCRRFKEAENNGLKCVLLYCGDHDPDGLRISETLRTNLEQIKDVVWEDGEEGYDPSDLIIDRFGLNYEFIQANRLTWIDNLITGSGGNLASPSHRNHELPYVKSYLRKIGEKKCEANAIVTTPVKARQMCEEAILNYLGDDAPDRFSTKRKEIDSLYNDELERFGLHDIIKKVSDEINDSDE
jgi:hypothetical protein